MTKDHSKHPHHKHPPAPPKPKAVTESQFYMWRTLFAMAHADNVIADEEVRFMAEALEDIPFTPEQKAILNEDARTPQDIVEMFMKITSPVDQAKFFKFAHDLVWADGTYDEKEQEMMLKLQRAHLKNTNVDDLIGKVELEFDDGKPRKTDAPKKPRATKDIVFSFRASFLKDKFGHSA